jgi:hypothetical protein
MDEQVHPLHYVPISSLPLISRGMIFISWILVNCKEDSVG